MTACRLSEQLSAGRCNGQGLPSTACDFRLARSPQPPPTCAPLPAQVGQQSGAFAAALLVGDLRASEPVQWELGSVEVLHAPQDDGSQPEAGPHRWAPLRPSGVGLVGTWVRPRCACAGPGPALASPTPIPASLLPVLQGRGRPVPAAARNPAHAPRPRAPRPRRRFPALHRSGGGAPGCLPAACPACWSKREGAKGGGGG